MLLAVAAAKSEFREQGCRVFVLRVSIEARPTVFQVKARGKANNGQCWEWIRGMFIKAPVIPCVMRSVLGNTGVRPALVLPRAAGVAGATFFLQNVSSGMLRDLKPRGTSTWATICIPVSVHVLDSRERHVFVAVFAHQNSAETAIWWT
jgi:hypothetical protein